MDLSQLTRDTVTFLTEHLPELRTLGWEATKGAAFMGGQLVLKRAADLWQKLRQQADAHPELQTPLADHAADPKNPDLQAALRVPLGKLLATDPVLAQELHTLLASAGSKTVIVNVSGQDNIVSGRDITIGSINRSSN